MVVVWGWANFFRRNISFVTDYCEKCGRHGHLRCYDAVRCFTLYWIPIIPLGRRRVNRECLA